MSETTDLDRRYDRLLEATDHLVEYWRAAHEPPQQQGTRTRSKPSSRPPLPVGVLSTLDAAWRDLRSWCQLIMEEREPALGPRTPQGPDLALFIARHADWLTRHEAGQDATDELGYHARVVRDMAKGNVTRRLTIGNCPELALNEEAERIERCEGQLVALVHYSDDMLPAAVRCSDSREHVWTASEWTALGRKLGRSTPQGVAGMMKAITGRQVAWFSETGA